MGQLRQLVTALGQRRLGFTVEETMRGVHRFLRGYPEGGVEEGQERPLELRLRWGHRSILRYLRPGAGFLSAQVEGLISAGGLCEEAPVSGSLELRYFRQAAVRYRLDFDAHGRHLCFDAQKRDLRPWNLHRTHTTCYGSVLDSATGEPLSDAVVTFELSSLPAMLMSFRLN